MQMERQAFFVVNTLCDFCRILNYLYEYANVC